MTTTTTASASTADTATRTKVAILVLADPGAGDEAIGRGFNAFAAAQDFHARGDDVQILFVGAGTRWIEALESPDHPVRGLYDAVRDLVAGVSCGCADVFGGGDAADAAGIERLTDNAVPGTTGLPSLPALLDDGYTLLSF